MATRLYFPFDTVADVNPAPGAWNYITEAVFRYLAKTKGASAITVGSQVGPWTATAGQKALDRVYVSDPLSPQTISGTVKMQLMVREYAATDNVNQINLLIKVVSGNGDTVRGTLLALGNYASTAEFINNATHRNKTGADGDALSSVVCQEHDRIVVEIGYCNSLAGTTPEASAKYGENATDLPENETQTTDGAGWIEFSGDIAFSTDPNLDKQVAASGDDGARRTGSLGFDAAITAAALGYHLQTTIFHAHIFALWTGVTIEGTIGANSYIECYAHIAGALTPELKVYVVDEADPPAPTSAAEFDADPLTTAAVDWDGAWTADLWAQSPSLALPLQEYVDTFGPIVNKRLMMQVKNDHGVTGSSEYNYPRHWNWAGNLHGPKLHIEYTAGGTPYSLVVDAGSYAVAGTAASLPVGRVMGAGAGSYAVAGTAVGLIKDILISVAAGSYALSGNAVSLPVDRVIGAGVGSYSLTGATVALLKDMLMGAGTGSYVLAGQDVSLPLGRAIAADAGNYVISGTAVDLIKSLLISAAAGNYALTGTAVDFLRGKIMVAGSGSYAITGADADLLKALIITAGGGTYVLTGSDVGLLYGKIMVAGSGSYVITGTAADLLVDLVMQALGGSYTLTGQAATLTSGAIILVGHPTGYAPFYPTPKDDALHATPMKDDLHATPKRSGSHATPRK